MIARFLVIIVLIAAAAFFFMRQKPQLSNTSTNVQPTEAAKIEASPSTAPSEAMTKGETKVIEVSGKSFAFTPSEIRVKKGDTVKINFTNTEGFHNFVVDEFKAQTKKISAGQTDSVQFVADKVGTFEYYCAVGNHRDQGMKGNLIVE